MHRKSAVLIARPSVTEKNGEFITKQKKRCLSRWDYQAVEAKWKVVNSDPVALKEFKEEQGMRAEQARTVRRGLSVCQKLTLIGPSLVPRRIRRVRRTAVQFAG